MTSIEPMFTMGLPDREDAIQRDGTDHAGDSFAGDTIAVGWRSITPSSGDGTASSSDTRSCPAGGKDEDALLRRLSSRTPDLDLDIGLSELDINMGLPDDDEDSFPACGCRIYTFGKRGDRTTCGICQIQRYGAILDSGPPPSPQPANPPHPRPLPSPAPTSSPFRPGADPDAMLPSGSEPGSPPELSGSPGSPDSDEPVEEEGPQYSDEDRREIVRRLEQGYTPMEQAMMYMFLLRSCERRGGFVPWPGLPAPVLECARKMGIVPKERKKRRRKGDEEGPKGDKGDKGDKGGKGDKGDKGEKREKRGKRDRREGGEGGEGLDDLGRQGRGGGSLIC